MSKTPSRYVVCSDGVNTECRTLLAAMKVVSTLVQAGHQDVGLIDRRAAVVWQAERLCLTALLDLDRGCMLAAQRSAGNEPRGPAMLTDKPRPRK